MFYICEVIGFVDWFDRFIEVLKCAIAYNPSLTVLSGWQDVRIQ